MFFLEYIHEYASSQLNLTMALNHLREKLRVSFLIRYDWEVKRLIYLPLFANQISNKFSLPKQ